MAVLVQPFLRRIWVRISPVLRTTATKHLRQKRMGKPRHWFLDEGKFFTYDELTRLRRSVRRRVERARFRRRLPWLEWFLVELSFEAGLRVFEVAALVCSDLNIRGDRPGVVVRCGKGGKPRYVRIRKKFVDVCLDFLAWKEATRESVDDEAPLFVSSTTGDHISVRGLQKMFTRSCKRVNITRHSIHHARHTYASHLYVASRKDLVLVQKQLGHASIRTTQVYAHMFDPEVTKAIEKLYA